MVEEDQEVESEFVPLGEEEKLEEKLEEEFEEDVEIMANEQRQIATESQMAMKDYVWSIIEVCQLAKFLKELNSNKRRYVNNEKVMVFETTSVLQQQLPPKMKVLRSFIIDITMGDKKVAKAILDLGANNLLPYSIYAQLGLRELKPTTMSLQLADRSIKHARGIVEDLLIQVGKLIIPTDFMVLDMENTPARDKEQTILLGRPFVATTKIVIDVHNRKKRQH
eukprot:XP_015580911.1 uncharacterized protein LOC107262056 [Ricinus communis]